MLARAVFAGAGVTQRRPRDVWSLGNLPLSCRWSYLSGKEAENVFQVSGRRLHRLCDAELTDHELANFEALDLGTPNK